MSPGMRLPRLFRTTPFRLTLLFLALFGAAASAFLAYIYVATAGEATRRTDQDITREMASLVAVYDRAGVDAVNQSLIERAASERPFLYLLMKRDGRGTTSTDNLAMKGNDLSPTLSLPKSSRGLLQRLASIRTGGGIIGGTGGRRGRRPLLSVEARRSLEGGGGGPAEEEQQGPPLLRGKSYTWDNNGTDMASILRDPEFHRSHDWAVA